MVGSEALPEFEDINFAEPVINKDINRTKIANVIDKILEKNYAILIKECKDSLLEPLELIFMKPVENSQLPNIWKKGKCNGNL